MGWMRYARVSTAAQSTRSETALVADFLAGIAGHVRCVCSASPAAGAVTMNRPQARGLSPLSAWLPARNGRRPHKSRLFCSTGLTGPVNLPPITKNRLRVSFGGFR
jgi:hypothetical protein